MEFDAKWLAGFFDGEGSVGIYARNVNRTKTRRYYLTVVSLARKRPKTIIKEQCEPAI